MFWSSCPSCTIHGIVQRRLTQNTVIYGRCSLLIYICDPLRRNQSHVLKQKKSVFDWMLYSFILAFQNCFCFSSILFLKVVMSLWSCSTFGFSLRENRVQSLWYFLPFVLSNGHLDLSDSHEIFREHWVWRSEQLPKIAYEYLTRKNNGMVFKLTNSEF